MATFIDNDSESEQAIELARFINKIKIKGKESSDAFTEEITQLSGSGRNLELLDRLVEESSVIFTDANDKEIEGFFFIVISLSKKLGDDAVRTVVSKIVERVTSNPDDKPLLRIRILNSLYNIVSNGALRYRIFQDLLNFASSSRNSELIFNQLKESDLDSKMTEWNLDSRQKRDLLKRIRDIFASQKSSRAFKWSTKYLSSLDVEGTEDEKRASLDEAVKIISEAIRIPDYYQYDTIMSTPIVARLETSPHPNHQQAHQLLKIFASETQEAYQAFTQRNSGFDLSSIGLNGDDVQRKIRVLSLATLGSTALGSQTQSSQVGSEISYATIAKTLQVPETEVELWVISAISENLISAKMDQLRRVVIVTRALQRVFSDNQWKQIGDTITNWRKNVKVMLNTLQETKKLNVDQQHAAFAKAIQQQS